MRNVFFGFVAHVGKAEGMAFEFAVAWVDHEVMFFAQVPREFQDVDAACVLDAGECLRAETFFGEKVEAGAADPVVHKRIGACVTIKAGV